MPLPRDVLDYNSFALDVTSPVGVGLDDSPGSLANLADLANTHSSAGAGGRRAPMPTMPPRFANGTTDGQFPALCYDMLGWFEFPVFEVLVTMQVSE